jgi:lysophospholipase
VPLGNQFVKARANDVIVAVDGSADLAGINWPNGSSILKSRDRMHNLLTTSHQQFPPIPDTAQDFLNTGVNMRPTFFGCDPTKTPAEYPMVIYFPNSPPLDGTDPVAKYFVYLIIRNRKTNIKAARALSNSPTPPNSPPASYKAPTTMS